MGMNINKTRSNQKSASVDFFKARVYYFSNVQDFSISDRNITFVHRRASSISNGATTHYKVGFAAHGIDPYFWGMKAARVPPSTGITVPVT